MVLFAWLKRIRVGISLLFLIVIGFLFIDFWNLFSSQVVNGAIYFQFVPSAIKFLHLATFLATGFLVVLLLTLLFGRVYCSFLCPLGTIQDVFYFFSKRRKKKVRRKYSPPKNLLRYAFLIVPVVFLLFGNLFFLNLLDPYSNFGRIVSNLIRPIVYVTNNIVTFFLQKGEVFIIKPIEYKSVSWLSLVFSLFVLGLLVFLSIKKGRLYCNTVCPVGTFLGMISRYSLFRISLDQSACTSCGICGNHCKADCIDTKTKKIDFSRCINCMNCLTVCPSNGVKYQLISPSDPVILNDVSHSNERRKLIKTAALIPLGIMATSKNVFSKEINQIKKATIPVVREFPVVPPGAESIKHFTEHCTACHLCVSSCPTQVIQPSFLEYGLTGMLQPRMDYKTSFCNYECTECTDVCPTGAIKPLKSEEKKLTQIGKSKFIKENCVVYTNETACGACSEHCPTKAVSMVPYEKKAGLKIPEVNNDYCIGCGACEYACPTDPKSIYVDGNPTHQLAKKPPENELPKSKKVMEDFPF